MIFTDLDEWAFDLEQEYKVNLDRKLRNKIIKLHRLRDKYYNIRLKEIEKHNRCGSSARRFPPIRYCIKRMPKPPNPVKQLK